jgi:hypothetical protein
MGYLVDDCTQPRLTGIMISNRHVSSRKFPCRAELYPVSRRDTTGKKPRRNNFRWIPVCYKLVLYKRYFLILPGSGAVIIVYYSIVKNPEKPIGKRRINTEKIS